VGELLGYARVSTTVQDPALQHDALSAAGCWRTWTDTASGAKTDRPQLVEVMTSLRPGDTLVVWRLDRLGRSLLHLVETVTQLEERGVGFRSLQEAIDTTTAGGRLVFHLFASLAHFERELIRERTMAGLDAARRRGRQRRHAHPDDSCDLVLAGALGEHPPGLPLLRRREHRLPPTERASAPRNGRWAA